MKKASDIIEQSPSSPGTLEINRGIGGRALYTSGATNCIISLQWFLLIFFVDPFLHPSNVKRSSEQSINLAYVYDPFLCLTNEKSSFRNCPAASMARSGEDATVISDRQRIGSPSEYFSSRTFSYDDVGMEACFLNSDFCRLSIFEWCGLLGVNTGPSLCTKTATALGLDHVLVAASVDDIPTQILPFKHPDKDTAIHSGGTWYSQCIPIGGT